MACRGPPVHHPSCTWRTICLAHWPLLPLLPLHLFYLSHVPPHCLLLARRGVLPPSAVAGVHTFGAPAVFCEGAAGGSSAHASSACAGCALPCSSRGAPRSPGGLLAALNLPETAVTNVVMSHDIVPRAFVCDYTVVADVLRRWVPGFREHGGLAACRTHKARHAACTALLCACSCTCMCC